MPTSGMNHILLVGYTNFCQTCVGMSREKIDEALNVRSRTCNDCLHL
jgi:hypothetical protein